MSARHASSTRYVLFSLVAIACAHEARAQSTIPAATANAEAKAVKTLSLADYGKWTRITGAAVSGDGGWVTYTYVPNEGDGTLYVRNPDNDKVWSATVGSAPAGGGGGGGGFGGWGGAAQPTFSDNSRWIGYMVNPSAASARAAAGGAARPGGPGGPPAGGATSAPRPTRRFELMSTATGETFSVPNAASFSFAAGSGWVAVKQNRVGTDTTRTGADLVLRELTTGMTRNIGNVGLYEFNSAGRLFAYTVDAPDKLGNGIYLLDLTKGETRPLDGAAADFDQLAWSADGAHLAVLRGTKAPGNKQKDNVLLAWANVERGADARLVTWTPSNDRSFVAGMVLSEFTAPKWSKDGGTLLVGIKEQDSEAPRADSAQANVDVWHWKDDEPQSVQMVRIQQLRRATYAAAVHLTPDGARFTRLADGDMRTVTYTPNGEVGVGRLDTPYRGQVAWGGTKADYYKVDLISGERVLIDKSLTRTMGVSPDGKWFLYLKDGRVRAFNLESGARLDLDAIAARHFVDAEDDHPYERPTYGVAGWSKDGSSVLLNHRYDVWQVPLAVGGKAVNLTNGIGDAQSIRFRLVRLDRRPGGPGGGGGGIFGGGDTSDDEGVDLSKPLIFSAYGQWTKKTGYWRAEPGHTLTPLVWEDRAIGQLQKARESDRLLFTQQTFREFPDLWVAAGTFASPKKITDANPQQREYAWGSKVLIDYRNRKGQRLQGTLTLPANYQPGKRYPMLVYFYEIMSNTHHQYSVPTFDDRPQMSTYASDGYLVLQPDVVYEIGKPGSSAVDCVTAAVKRVIELGYADPKHIGLQGHSWGGYQSSFIVTQTDMFAAVVTGAPPTNLVSFYDELYKSTGTVQQGIMELGQVRMGENVTPWNSHDLYESQSPIHQATKIKTPFLILHGTDDGAVDWHQGLEYFNAARRLGKNVILLSYPGEPHHLAKKENQKDFQVRMKQYFDHYLKGTPAPRWMTDGVPQVRKGSAAVM